MDITFNNETHFSETIKLWDVYERHADLFSKKHVGLDVPVGWIDIVIQFLEFIVKHSYTDVMIQKISMSYRAIKFYYMGGDQALHDEAGRLEKISMITCEVCGHRGKMLVTGLETRTRCADHADTVIEPFTEAQTADLHALRTTVTKKMKNEVDD